MEKSKLIITDKKVKDITPDMIGLFFEDINFAADGGLYAEMIENRSFEAVRSAGKNHDYVFTRDALYAWTALGEGKLEVSENAPVNEKNPHYARFTANKPGDGFANKAYDGITLKKGMKYKVSFYAKEVVYFTGDIEVCVTKDGKNAACAKVEFTHSEDHIPEGMEAILGDVIARKWIKYETELVAEADITGGVFEIHLTDAGSIEFDIVSMIPEDAVMGVFRKDLFEALADLKPGFLRFPGGCIVEGTSIMRRYRWKDTVGKIESRKVNTNLWAVQGGNTIGGWDMPDNHYMQSYGIGFYEYFCLCELLSSDKRKCKAVPVLNIGVACQFRSYETVATDTPEFDEYIQDALDLIEFANGDVNTKWGALRASMGHPASFELDMIAIGNEQWESRHVNLRERYILFEKAIHDRYPEIKCLGTAGPFVKNSMYDDVWKYYRDEEKKKPGFVYAVDEHYYVAPEWLYENVDFYDDYPRDVAVFAGEYASHDANLSNSMESGLAEAAMITGMERNADIVKLASYAPLLNRIGHSQWTPDMIWFDNEKVVLTPSYYVQKMFSDNAGSQAVWLDGQEKALRDKKLYVSVVKDAENTVIKVVNASDEPQVLELEGAAGALNVSAEVTTLISALDEYQMPKASAAVSDADNKVMPVGSITNAELCKLRAPEDVIYSIGKEQLCGEVELKAKSFTVIRF